MQRENRSASETNVWPTDKKRRRWMLQEGGIGAKIFIGSASCRGPAGSNLSPRSLLDAVTLLLSAGRCSPTFLFTFLGLLPSQTDKKRFYFDRAKNSNGACSWKKKNPSHLHKSVACKNSAQFSEPLKRCVQIVVVSSYSLEKCPTIHQSCSKSQKN